MEEPRIRLAGATHLGMVRDNQEDAWLIREPESGTDRRRHGRLLVVADGIGGSQAGEVASNLAVTTIAESYFAGSGEPRSRLRGAIQDANRRILEETEIRADRRGMGSTVVAAVIYGDQLVVAWLGDSRAYLVRDREVTQLTRDHHGASVAGIRVQEGGLTRWLGMGISVDPDVRQISLRPGDAAMICTDGIHSLVSPAEIGRFAREGPEKWSTDLVDLALKRGAPDNVTAVCARVDRLPFAPHRHAALAPGVLLDDLRLDHFLAEDQFYVWFSAHDSSGRKLLSVLRPELQEDMGLLLDMEGAEEALARVSAPSVARVERADAEKSLAYACLRLPWEDDGPGANARAGELHSLDQVLAMLGGRPGAIEPARAVEIAIAVADALSVVRSSLLPAGAPHPSDFWGDGERYALCHWPGAHRQYWEITSKGMQANPLLEAYIPPDFTASDIPGPAADAYFAGCILQQLLGRDLEDPGIPPEVASLCAALLSERSSLRPDLTPGHSVLR